MNNHTTSLEQLKAKIESLKMGERKQVEFESDEWDPEKEAGNSGYNQAVDEFNARIDKLLEEL